MLEVSEPWLQNYVNGKYEAVPRQVTVPAKPKGRLTVQMDELWSFVDDQGHEQWVWLALDVVTREIVGCSIGDLVPDPRSGPLWRISESSRCDRYRRFIDNVPYFTVISGFLIPSLSLVTVIEQSGKRMRPRAADRRLPSFVFWVYPEHRSGKPSSVFWARECAPSRNRSNKLYRTI